MPDVRVIYNNSEIAALSKGKIITLRTKSTVCEDDITIEYNRPSPLTAAAFITGRNTRQFSCIEDSNVTKIDDYVFYRASSLASVSLFQSNKYKFPFLHYS